MRKTTNKSTTTITRTTERVVRAPKRKLPTAQDIANVFQSGLLFDIPTPNARLIAIYLYATGQTLDDITNHEVANAIGSWPHKIPAMVKSLRDSRTLAELLNRN